MIGERGLPKGYNKLDFSLSDSSALREQLNKVEVECSVDNEEHDSSDGSEFLPVVSAEGTDEKSNDKIDSEVLFEKSDDNENIDKKAATKKWYITRMEKGHVSQIHVSRAIKMLLPREFISRNRSQRHLASVYLPGKSPFDPEHDILKFADVAIKTNKGKKKYFKLGRIVSLQEKGGSDILSASSKKGKGFRFRCSLYQQNGNIVSVPADVLVSDWMSGGSILGPVNLRKTGVDGVYELAAESLDCLMKIGYLPLPSESVDNNGSEESCRESDFDGDEKNDLLKHGFSEVDDIVDRRINCKTHEFEYRVRFRGYTESDDVWLPASSFNRPVDFASRSRYGRKRFHKTNVDEASIPLSGVENVETGDSVERNPKRKCMKGPQDHPKQTNAKTVDSGTKTCSDLKAKSRTPSIKNGTKFPKTDTNEAKTVGAMTLDTATASVQDNSVNNQSPPSANDHYNSVLSANVADTALLKADLLQIYGRFCSPRMVIASYHTPPVRRCTFSLSSLNVGNCVLADPFAVDWIPPEKVLNEASKRLHSEGTPVTHVVKFNGLGTFNAQSLRVLQNYVAFKSIASKAVFEEQWLQEDTRGVSPNERLHLLNTVLYLPQKNSGLIAKRNGIEIYVDDLTTLCGERYLNDKVIDYMLNMFEERANRKAGKTICLSLSTFLSPEQMGEGAMKMLYRVSLTHDISTLQIILLPCVIESNHWGLIVFDLILQGLFYDDGFHLNPPSIYVNSCVKVLKTLFENSRSERFNVAKWKSLSLESFGMPDQPHSGIGSASCAIGVLLAARDISSGVRDFGWTFKEAPY